MKVFIAIAISSVLVCSQIVGTSGAPQQRTSSNFAFKLYSQLLKQDTNTNVFVSPTSVSLALAMTYNGAEGKTREAMARVLEVEGLNLNEVNSAFAELQRPPTGADPKVQLKIANSLWSKQGFTLKPEFLDRARQYYEAKVTSLDFNSPAAPNAINSWVKEKTNNLIDSIVNRIPPDTVLYLINAIYFKGQWQTEFEKGKTKPDQFHLANGQQKEVQMMSQSGSYLYYEGKDFQAVSLPYGEGRISMYLFLPGQDTTLNDFHKNLTSAEWEKWMQSFRITPGDVMLPRFKVEYEVTLNDTLKALGMAEAFNPAQADFSGLAKLTPEQRLFISEVRHKALAEVNEEGTKAAAVTSVGVSLTSISIPPKPFVMKVDRPFFFAIRDNATGSLLFMGSIVDPQ